MIKYTSLQDYITNCDNPIDSLDYWDDLKKVNPDKDYFIEPDWGDMELRDRAYIVSKIHYLFPNSCPKWVFDKKYVLEDPYFPGDFKSDKLRLLLMIESPMEFKLRNIFISENGLNRV